MPTSLKDWIDDLNFAKLGNLPGCSGCAVHTGFYDSWHCIKAQVVSALQRTPEASSGVYITGHSLGAAIASLAAFDLVGLR